MTIAGTSPDSHPHEGFIARWMRGCGERPWRRFILTWIVLALLALGLALIGRSRTDIPIVAPSLNDIPYADFLPGGMRGGEIAIDPPPQMPPAMQGRPRRNDLAIEVVTTNAQPHEARLIARQLQSTSDSGWPWVVFGKGVYQQWDVTSPRTPFPLFVDPGGFDLYQAGPVIGCSWRDRSGRMHFLSLLSPGSFQIIFFPQILAAALVIPGGWIWRRRRLHRSRRGQCLECAHALDAAGHQRVCPECGERAPEPGRSGPPRLRIWSRLLRPPPMRAMAVLAALLIAGWVSRVFHHPRFAAVESLRAALAMRANPPVAYVARLHLEYWDYGWPGDDAMICVQRDAWYAVAPGSEPRPAAPTQPSGVHAAYGSINWFRIHSDGTTSTLITLQWMALLLHLSLLHIAATLIVACFLGARAAMRKAVSFGRPVASNHQPR